MASQRTLVFLDACILVDASHSPSGGSAPAIEVCRGRRFQAALSARVLLEARMNIAEKFSEPELLRFYQQMAVLSPKIVSPPSSERLAWCASLVGEKDSLVLASALECGAVYLRTLDRRHLITPDVQSAGLPLKVLTPGDFLKGITASANAKLPGAIKCGILKESGLGSSVGNA